MIRQMQGLDFKVHSPSLFELMSLNPDTGPDAVVIVTFLGDKWFIAASVDQRNWNRPFATRDAAIALLASRAQVPSYA